MSGDDAAVAAEWFATASAGAGGHGPAACAMFETPAVTATDELPAHLTTGGSDLIWLAIENRPEGAASKQPRLARSRFR
jgi:hypothetical protein